ncbi:hypothetical protein ANAEL_03352 [Anaerolineales bacterium]|nr:hypothetical protein ANAEL_03352 [Anaerolineales bacterium]
MNEAVDIGMLLKSLYPSAGRKGTMVLSSYGIDGTA